MSPAVENPPKLGTEITVRVSLTFQEAPDVHTLLAMTPVRERGKLVRLALERYIIDTAHPAGDIEQQILAVSTWLRSRKNADAARSAPCPTVIPMASPLVSVPISSARRQFTASTAIQEKMVLPIDDSPSINRWLDS
jgi:hypothetical protein